MDPISVDANPSGSNKLRALSRLPSSPIPNVQIQSIEGHALTDIGKLAERVESSSVSIRLEVVSQSIYPTYAIRKDSPILQGAVHSNGKPREASPYAF
jgi:hypothetical protein